MGAPFVRLARQLGVVFYDSHYGVRMCVLGHVLMIALGACCTWYCVSDTRHVVVQRGAIRGGLEATLGNRVAHETRPQGEA